MIELLFAVALSQQQIQDQCVYQAGVASRVQEVRQEGDDWEAFKATTQKIYKDDEGYHNLLGIAYLVYHQMPAELNPDQVFDLMFDTCKAGHKKPRKTGKEFNL
jgi:hypothetical protein